MNINEKIKLARKKAGLTQEQIAERLGIKQPNYQIYEKNVTPSLERLIEIAECGLEAKSMR